jgi:hypothetical protein
MTKKCGVCGNLSSSTNSVTCSGPCGRIIHHDCTGLDSNIIDALVECSNLSFNCDACQLKCYKPLEDQIEALKDEVGTLKTLVNGLISMSSASATVAATDQSATPLRVQPTRKGKMPNKPNASTSTATYADKLVAFLTQSQTSKPAQPNTPKSNTQSDHPAGAVVGTGPKPDTISLAEPKFWVYLSKLDPTTDETQLQQHLASTFKSNSIRCVKLLPQGKSQDSCEFISFKLGFPMQLKDAAMNPNSWPEGFVVREFIDKPRSTNFRSRQRMSSTNRTPSNHQSNRYNSRRRH